MRGLTYFLAFNVLDFFELKTLVVTSVTQWLDFKTKEHLGTKVEVFISEDATEYPTPRDGGQISNLGQSFAIKVPHDVSVKIGDVVEMVNPVATVYGEYRNQLSVKADDVVVVAGKGAKA